MLVNDRYREHCEVIPRHKTATRRPFTALGRKEPSDTMHQSAGTAPLVFHLDIRWRRIVGTQPRKTDTRYQVNRRLGEGQSRSGRFGEEISLSPVLGTVRLTEQVTASSSGEGCTVVRVFNFAPRYEAARGSRGIFVNWAQEGGVGQH